MERRRLNYRRFGSTLISPAHRKGIIEVALKRLQVLHIVHIGSRWPPANLSSELVEFVLWPCGSYFYRSVFAVPHPPAKLELPCNHSHKPPEANPLHPSRYQ